MFELILGVIFFVLPLSIFGLLIGRTIERRHFRRLDADDAVHRDFLVTQLKSFPSAVGGASPPTLVVAEVVIASDYLKNFFASWRSFFGGEVRSYTRITERAKREAIARLVRQAEAAGYNAVCNVRVETVDMGGNNSSRRKNAMSGCIASGTAYHVSAAAG